jgi:two-component SAPR family response regulator
MANSGLIILIEDDPDDIEIFESITRELSIPNEIKIFSTTNTAFDFLKTTKKDIFLIFSDINLPDKNGVEFKRSVDNDPQLRQKSIPFVFLSTIADQRDVTEAYTKMTVQGFFKKPSSYSELKLLLDNIYTYWKNSRHPNS